MDYLKVSQTLDQVRRRFLAGPALFMCSIGHRSHMGLWGGEARLRSSAQYGLSMIHSVKAISVGLLSHLE